MEFAFKDRREAGKKLAYLLLKYPRQESIILTPLNESMIVGKTVSGVLGIPCDLLPVAPLHHPFRWEESIGAVAEDGVLVSGTEHPAYVAAMIPLVRQRLIDRMAFFKREQLFHVLKNKNVIVVTDGCRTGLKLLAAMQFIAQRHPSQLIVAAPVMSGEAQNRLKSVATGFHSLVMPLPYESTGAFYTDFRLYRDEELVTIFRGKDL